jgi:lipopolysaccharide transport system permease protein
MRALLSFRSLLAPWSHRDLIVRLGVRDVSQRFRSSKLGMFWAAIQPLAVVATFYFVFVVVFKSRWRSADEASGEFVLALFAGLLVYNLFSEIVSKAPTLITGNPNFVKKLVFPLDILPFSAAVGALISASISALIWIVAFVCVRESLPYWTTAFLPVLLLPTLLFAIGTAWALSSLCTYFRDVSHAVPLVLQALIFLSPVLYAADRVPAGFLRDVMAFNPLLVPIELTRAALIEGKIPDWVAYGWNLCGAMVVFQFGYAFFMRTRPGFADVL